jgi:hypothetical protein
VGLVCGDILPAFFGKYLPPERWPGLRDGIPDSLRAALEMPNAFERQFYAGNHLMGIRSVDASVGGECEVLLSWDTQNGSGEERHPVSP